MIRIASEALAAEINPFGAELSSLADAGGRELMTDADPAFWTGRAPLLFPIVGRLRGDRYRIDGREYSLPQHGFARRQMFEPRQIDPSRARFRLVDNEETRAAYPFAFLLEADFRLRGRTLTAQVTVENRGERDMPACFGFHPAFAWPLPYGKPRADHAIVFERDEPSPVVRLDRDGLIARQPVESPLAGGRTLPLDDALFGPGAVIWPRIESRAVRYGATDGPSLEVAFPDTGMLGVWSKPGARFVCIEPWHGLADFAGAEGDVWEKPGMVRMKPGESRAFTMQVTLRE